MPMVPLTAGVGVGLPPLSALVPSVRRLATVTERTAAITPFTTPEREEAPL